MDADKSTPDGSWTRLVKRDGQAAAGFSRGEGLTVYQLPDGTWCAMADNGGYTAYLTDDLASGTFEKSSEASFVDGRFRHGTVMRLSETEQARLLEAYGEDTSDEPDEPEKEAEEPVLEYTFEEVADNVIKDTATGNDTADDGTMFGSAKVVYDEERDSNVLQLDGSSGGYAQLPTGFFDGRDTMTISMDVKSNLGSGNFFTFTYGKNSTSYDFLRVRGTEVRNAITTAGWQNEREVKGNGAVTGTWQKIDIVIDGVTMKLYIDGLLVSENDNTGITTSNFGTGVISYLGKSFYDDPYFNGSFDNVKVYNRALSEEEIVEDALADENVTLLKDAVIGTVPEDPSTTMATDYHTAVTSKLDAGNKVITSYIRKNADLSAVPVDFSALGSSTEIKVNGETFENGSSLDLSQDAEVTLTFGDRTETWTLKTPEIAYNPVLPGQYADPDIDFMDGKYWMYTTTDGYSGWSGTVFHVWSSDDMRNWTDEGVILDLANDNPGLNDNGVQIEASDWAVGSAWAPTIEEKDGKYYFYYCGKFDNGTSAIGVAVADNPAGPYTDKGEALITVNMCWDAGVNMGQAIDPSIFTDDDGTSYILFGNGSAAIAELNDDMMSIKEGTLRQINGVTDFRESPVVVKRDGVYHFTWSCDDTGSPNYHVNYGTTSTLEGDSVNVTYKYTLLQKDESNDMLGTAHQSMLYFPETDECYIAYHRFYTPIGIYTDGLGYHRETCIDQVTFGEDGLMQPLSPTMEGVYRPVNEEPEPIDTAALQSAVDSAKALDTNDYTEGSYADVKEALDAAEAMLADPTSQEEVNAAAAALQSAVENLVSIAELREYCAGHADYTEDAYTAESYAAYAEAFEAAQAVLGKADASQDEVDAALAALTEAVNGLEEKPDVEVSKDALQNLYDQYKDTEQGSYTDESYAAFTEALENAAAVLADENASQTDVDDAFNTLNSAAEALTEKTEDPGTEEPGTEDPGTDKPGTDRPSTDKPSSGKPEAEGGKDTASAVQTGDTTNLLVPAIVAVIALAAVAAVIIIRKKRK